jgi:hypothetical protein
MQYLFNLLKNLIFTKKQPVFIYFLKIISPLFIFLSLLFQRINAEERAEVDIRVSGACSPSLFFNIFIGP